MSIPVAVVNLTVLKVEERKLRTYVSGFGDTAVFEEESLGWFVIVDGNLAIKVSVGAPPRLAPGDRLRMTLERVEAPIAEPAGSG